jgi:hypothetical protein
MTPGLRASRSTVACCLSLALLVLTVPSLARAETSRVPVVAEAEPDTSPAGEVAMASPTTGKDESTHVSQLFSVLLPSVGVGVCSAAIASGACAATVFTFGFGATIALPFVLVSSLLPVAGFPVIVTLDKTLRGADPLAALVSWPTAAAAAVGAISGVSITALAIAGGVVGVAGVGASKEPSGLSALETLAIFAAASGGGALVAGGAAALTAGGANYLVNLAAEELSEDLGDGGLAAAPRTPAPDAATRAPVAASAAAMRY